MSGTKLRLRASSAQGYVVALGLTGIVTGAIWVIGQVTDVANISMLYLLAVMASAIFFGNGPAILASVAAFLAFDFFFIDPRHHLTVSEPEEWVALGLLLVTGVITGQLAAALRNRAREARRREREAVVLYDVLRLMIGADLRNRWLPSRSACARSWRWRPWSLASTAAPRRAFGQKRARRRHWG